MFRKDKRAGQIIAVTNDSNYDNNSADVAYQLKTSQSTAGRTTITFDSAGNQLIEQSPTE